MSIGESNRRDGKEESGVERRREAGNPWEGFEVISTYSRAQALEDGVLVDVSELAREAGFRYPVAVTTAVWTVLNKYEGKSFAGQSWQGRLWDLLTILKIAVRSAPQASDSLFFAPLFIMESADRPRAVKMWCKVGPADDLAPVMTIMLRFED